MNQEKIGKFISTMRKKKDLTQEQLAEKLNVSKNAVSKWERGLNLPDASIMQDVCSILDISLNELFAGEKLNKDEQIKHSEQTIINILKNQKHRNKIYKICLSILIVVVLIIIVMHITEVPAAFATIIKSAFGFKAVAGGAMGSIIVAMQKGIARGIFSNEAGIGSAPIAAAAVQTTEPVRQGLVSMLGTVIDTIIICTMTGLSIVITGSWDKGLEGVAVTTRAFQVGLPFPAKVSAFILMLCLVFFAFTTILGWDYYSERCLDYLTGNNRKVVRAYRWIYIACVFIGPYMTVSAVWTIADIVNGLMAIPNLIALLALNGVVVAETKKYFKKF